jgi:hypothetical protein
MSASFFESASSASISAAVFFPAFFVNHPAMARQ